MKKRIANSIVRTAMGSFILLAFTNGAHASEKGSFVKYEMKKKKKKKGCGCGHYEVSIKQSVSVS